MPSDLLTPSPDTLKEYRSSLCIITTPEDFERARAIIDRSYVSVAVVNPTLSITTLPLAKTSVNVMTREEYLAASNWHFDHTM